MKVIDLLNKIAKGEEVPKKIKYDTIEYFFRNYDYKKKLGKYIDEQSSFIKKIDFYKLNDEVGTIEEEQDIEHYDYCDNPDVMIPSVIANNFQRLNEDLDIIIKAVNELNKNER